MKIGQNFLDTVNLSLSIVQSQCQAESQSRISGLCCSCWRYSRGRSPSCTRCPAPGTSRTPTQHYIYDGGIYDSAILVNANSVTDHLITAMIISSCLVTKLSLPKLINETGGPGSFQKRLIDLAMCSIREEFTRNS